jgi:hypothetical protein
MPTLHNQTDDGSSTGGGDPFADWKDDDLGEDGPARPHHKAAPLVATGSYTEKCEKCRGTGSFYSYTGRYVGPCHACKGAGKMTFKTSPDQRAHARKLADQRKAAREKAAASAAAAKMAEWTKANLPEATWIADNWERFDFANAMRQSLMQWGSLTANQLAAVQRCIARDIERAAERAKAEAEAPPVNTVNLLAVEEAFGRAKVAGIKWPKLRLDGFVLSPAGENSANAGAIYVKDDGGTYLGKVLGGAFQRGRDCNDEVQQGVLAAMADPLASAVAYGKKYGRCSICARELSDPESIERGIGPVCATKYFGG